MNGGIGLWCVACAQGHRIPTVHVISAAGQAAYQNHAGKRPISFGQAHRQTPDQSCGHTDRRLRCRRQRCGSCPCSLRAYPTRTAPRHLKTCCHPAAKQVARSANSDAPDAELQGSQDLSLFFWNAVDRNNAPNTGTCPIHGTCCTFRSLST